MRARDEWEAMTPKQRIAALKEQDKPLPLYELGKNFLTGEMVYTNQPAKTTLEQDERLAKFVKSNKVYADRLSGKVKPPKGGMMEDYNITEDEQAITVPSSETPPAPTLSAPTPNILSELRYFQSPNLKSRTPPSTFETALNESPASLSKNLSPEAQAVVAINEAAKVVAPGVSKAIFRAAETLPVIGGAISRARLVAATPEISRLAAGPGLEAVKKLEAKSIEAAPVIAEKMSPMAIRAALGATKLAPKVATKIGSVAQEVTQYNTLDRQVKERASRRAALGELYTSALADEQRKASSSLPKKTKSNKLVSSGSR